MTLEEITAREGQFLDQIAECKRLRADCDKSLAASAPAPVAAPVELLA